MFNADTDMVQQPGALPTGGNPINHQRSISPHFQGQEQKPAPDNQAQAVPQRKKTQGKAKQILYSDKSETSVEELMDDTPSNYNI